MDPIAEPQLVVLTGLGADERLFDAQRKAFPRLVTPRWIPPQRREGLAEYAERLVAQLGAAKGNRPLYADPVPGGRYEVVGAKIGTVPQIPIARPFILGGCSLGGMMAYELAHSLRPDALVLIASAVTRDAIPLHFRALARIAWMVPTAGYGLGKRWAPPILSLLRRRSSAHRRLVTAMARDASSDFLRWACMAVGRWEPRPPSGVPTYTIHGDRDHILPLGNRSADFLIRGAGHLLTVTHPAEVNAALQEVVCRVAQAAGLQRPANVDTTSESRQVEK